MHPSRDEVLRVGLRLVIVALLVGLLVLLFNPSADSAELGEAPASEREALLLAPDSLRSGEERAAEAKTLLRDERRRRSGNLAAHVADLGMRAAMQLSPRRLLASARDVARDIVEWRKRSPAEDRALALLEGEHRAARLDSATDKLYRKLNARDRAERSDRLLDDAEAALEKGLLWRARRGAHRALELNSDPERASRLLERAEAAERQRIAELEARPARDFERWEAGLAAALLVDDFERVAQLSADRSDAELARAAARYLSGERALALDHISALGEGPDAAGATARRWLSDPGMNPELELSAELSRYKRRRVLGWVGGATLAEHGLDVSVDGYSAWRESLGALNLAVAAPSRLASGWRPEAPELRAAAERYLEILPQGERSAEALGWLEVLPVDSDEVRSASLWQDGLLVLPPSTTDYRNRTGRPILVSLQAIDAQWMRNLGVEIEGADAVLLSALAEGQADALQLSSSDALELIAHLADGLEARTLEPDASQERGAVLEALRMLDTRLRAGDRIALETWVYVDKTTTTVSLQHALDTEPLETPGLGERLRALPLVRGRNDVSVTHAFLAPDECPDEIYCIARARAASSDVYARFGVDGDVQVGARAGFADASIGFELGIEGAQASFSLPLAHWLGLGRWIPLEASMGVGLDGVSIGAQLGEPPEEPAPASVY